MCKKESYEKPETEIIRFETEDVITASGLYNGYDGSGESYGYPFQYKKRRNQTFRLFKFEIK